MDLLVVETDCETPARHIMVTDEEDFSRRSTDIQSDGHGRSSNIYECWFYRDESWYTKIGKGVLSSTVKPAKDDDRALY